MEDVVAEDQADRIAADELPADDECLGQAVGRGLFGIGEAHAVIAAVAQEPPERGQVVGRGDDEDVADAGQHQRRNGVVDHRLVVDGEHLLAHALGDGVEPRPRPSGQNDSFHRTYAVLNVMLSVRIIIEMIPIRILSIYV